MLETALKTLLGKTDVTHIRQRSALNPFLFLSGLGLTGGVALCALVPGLQWLGAIIAGAPILSSLGVGVYFAVRDPDRLQGEDYLAQRHSIAALHAMTGPVNDPDLLMPIPNPRLSVASDERIALGASKDAITATGPAAAIEGQTTNE